MSNATSERFSFENIERKNIWKDMEKFQMDYELGRKKSKIKLESKMVDDIIKNIERISLKLKFGKNS